MLVGNLTTVELVTLGSEKGCHGILSSSDFQMDRGKWKIDLSKITMQVEFAASPRT